MEIQQHDGVVVEVAGSRQGFAKRKRGGRSVTGGRGRRQALGMVVLPSPLYIGPLEGGASPGTHLQGGAAARGETYPPSQVGRPPPPWFPTLGAWGEAQGGRPSPLRAGSLPLSAHGALQDRWPHPVDPRDPSGGPGTIPVTPETFPVAET